MVSDDVVIRLHRCVVEELRRRGHPRDRPVRVAELHEEVVPYRAVRQALGVELNADYEHALLRLLAGDRGLARLEPPEARAELRQEVEAPYPAVGKFRQFSDCDVWISMGPPAEDDPAPAPAPQAPRAEGSSARARSRPRREGSGPARCRSCDGVLPAGPAVRFCPHCGRAQGPEPCPGCEAPLEPGWRYCVRCGHEVAGA